MKSYKSYIKVCYVYYVVKIIIDILGSIVC